MAGDRDLGRGLVRIRPYLFGNQRRTATCLAVQAIADDNDIDVDIGCEDE